MSVRRSAAALALVLGAAPALAAPEDYPTEVLADYIFACMATNGQTQDALRRCSCSIDHIAERLPYDAYAEAETVIRMRMVPSGDDRIVMFRISPWAIEKADNLRRAQIAAEFACF